MRFYGNAGVVGLEPTVPVLETGGLPLTDTPRLQLYLFVYGVLSQSRTKFLYLNLRTIAFLLTALVIVIDDACLGALKTYNVACIGHKVSPG
jgi:hypothetical protein